jgi:hypothetical protein
VLFGLAILVVACLDEWKGGWVDNAMVLVFEAFNGLFSKNIFGPCSTTPKKTKFLILLHLHQSQILLQPFNRYKSQ